MGSMFFPPDSVVSPSKEQAFGIDLEIGANSMVSEKEGRSGDVSCIGMVTDDRNVMSSPKDLSRVDGRPSDEGKVRYFVGQDEMSLMESKSGKERVKEKSLRKPSKPPKPPKALSLDPAEQKIAREMAELAVQKRLRMERMKAIRNMKNANAGFNIGKFCALFVTVLFCVIIIWHGMTSNGGSVVKADGSDARSLLNYGGPYH
ncbi:uncharacterized protein LOC110019953 [Phalaenopsis equestris]|uniref:uncharacterized protein LOC110019953 n=1 Tax=Phalaenopsis equestris TaxID=78828 RepID=UPI0009E3D892|nr:uncharacterized protein LOC110019953 [Phalaenopsis equestris]